MIAPSTTALTLLSTLFRGLADPARLSYLLSVREHERTVSEVVAATGLSQPNTSKHLACLRDCGLVQARRSGRNVYYALADASVENVLQTSEALMVKVGPTIVACPIYGERNKP
jgi:ArsR family transcriptional regulator, cadmium/lead-responsive transcriptional repressor